MNSMDLEKVSKIMDKFENQFEDLDVRTSVSIINHIILDRSVEISANLIYVTQVIEDAMGSATTLSTPKEQVDTLIQQIAEENGLEIQEQLAQVPTTSLRESREVEREDELSKRCID